MRHRGSRPASQQNRTQSMLHMSTCASSRHSGGAALSVWQEKDRSAEGVKGDAARRREDGRRASGRHEGDQGAVRAAGGGEGVGEFRISWLQPAMRMHAWKEQVRQPSKGKPSSRAAVAAHGGKGRARSAAVRVGHQRGAQVVGGRRVLLSGGRQGRAPGIRQQNCPTVCRRGGQEEEEGASMLGGAGVAPPLTIGRTC